MQSVGEQSERRFVHRLVDDGSTDGSLALAQAAARADPRLEVIALPAVGRRDALVAAHRNVTTELVAWLDADDWLEPHALERTLAVMRAWPDAGLVFTDHTRVDRDGSRVRAPARPSFSQHGMLVDFSTFHFRLIRRAAFEAAGEISDLEIGIDYDLCLRLAELAPVVHLAEPLYAYRVHAKQISNVQRRAQIEASATAVRRAIARRGLADAAALDVDARSSRFRLRARELDAPRRWYEHARLAVRTLVRSRGRRSAELCTASVWPTRRDDLLATSLADGLHRRALALVPVAPGLPALLRSTWSGQIGSVLIVHGIAAAVGHAQPGRRAAQRRLLVTALDRARAQGTRIVWSTWADAHDRRLDSETTHEVARRCDAVVADAPDAVTLPADVPVIVTPPGHVLELQPVMSRVAARARLGLPIDATTFVRLGPVEDAQSIEKLAEAFVGGGAELVVRGPAPSPEVERALASAAIDHPQVHIVLQPLDARGLACAVGAADAVLLADGPHVWPLALVTRARGRVLVLPEDVKGVHADRRYRSLAELREPLHAVDRRHALDVTSDAVAELVLASLRDRDR